MSSIYERLLQQARQAGACRLADATKTDADSMVNLFFSPQGREYCIGRGYPTLSEFRMMRGQQLHKQYIFCDWGAISDSSGIRYGLIGKTRAYLQFSGTKASRLVVLMHGAEAVIELSNYAVVKVDKTPDCKVKIINKDNTGVVLW